MEYICHDPQETKHAWNDDLLKTEHICYDQTCQQNTSTMTLENTRSDTAETEPSLQRPSGTRTGHVQAELPTLY